MSRARLTDHAQREIRRLVTRFAIERMAAGFSIECLAMVADAPGASVIRRVENGDTVPELPTLIRMGEAAGLRLDWVPEYLVPLLALDEFEVRALIVGATEGWRHSTGWGIEDQLVAALRKLGRLTGGEGAA